MATVDLARVDQELTAECTYLDTVLAEAAEAWAHDQLAIFHGAMARIARSTALIETLLDRRNDLRNA